MACDREISAKVPDIVSPQMANIVSLAHTLYMASLDACLSSYEKSMLGRQSKSDKSQPT
jgi:hypothetical protein